MLVKTRALVLHSLKYGDSKLIVDLFTENEGRVSIIQTISSSRHGRIRRQLFQPLTILDVVYDVHPKGSLQRLKEARMLYPYSSIPFDAAKLSLCIFVSEFLCQATRNEQQNVPLFNYVMASMRWLDGCERPAPNFHLMFMLRLALFLGFQPNVEDEGVFFDLRAACFVAQAPLHPDFLSAEDSKRLRVILRMNFDNMHLFAMSRADRSRCVDIILTYYRLHFPDFKELKSLAVLKELFG